MTSLRSIVRAYKDFILSVVVIFLVVIGYFGGIYPAAQQVVNLFEQKNILQEEQAMLEEKITILDSLDEQVLRTDLATVIAAVPSDKSIPTLFQTIEGLADTTGVALNSINISSVGDVATQSATIGTTALEKQIGSQLLPFVAGLSGSFEAIQQFITSVPTVRRLVRIRTFSMTFPKDDSPLSIAFEMDSFYEPFPTTLGPQSAPIFALTQKEQQVITTLSQFPIIGLEIFGPGLAPSAQIKQNPFTP